MFKKRIFDSWQVGLLKRLVRAVRLGLSVPLYLSYLGFLGAWWLYSESKCSKRQNVEITNFVRSECKNWLWVKESQLRFKREEYRLHLSIRGCQKL